MKANRVKNGTLSSKYYKPISDLFLRFRTGQPLGLLSSWPIFAFYHHVLVWSAAELVYPGRHFQDYCLLGDDIMICDKKVAKMYQELIHGLGVSISK